MLSRNPYEKVYLAIGSTDMRKSINGLSAIVQETFALDLFSASLFVFCNKNRDKIKILQWENCGFWLYYRRLEKGRFLWPKADSYQALSVTRRELNWLLDGLSIDQKQAHTQVTANAVI